MTGHSISIDEAREYERSHPWEQTPSVDPTASGSEHYSGLPASADEPQPVVQEETRVLTFAELQELIESGKEDQIPNNKVIAEALNVSLISYFHPPFFLIV